MRLWALPRVLVGMGMAGDASLGSGLVAAKAMGMSVQQVSGSPQEADHHEQPQGQQGQGP